MSVYTILMCLVGWCCGCWTGAVISKAFGIHDGNRFIGVTWRMVFLSPVTSLYHILHVLSGRDR